MVKWHPSQDVLFSCSYDDTVKVWGPDGDDWCCKETLTGHESTVWCITWDHAGSRFVTCSDDRTVRVWAPAAEAEAILAAAASDDESDNAQAPSLPGRLSGAAVSASAYLSPLFRAGYQFASAAKPGYPAPAKPDLATQEHAAVASRSAPASADCQWRVIGTIKGSHSRPIYSVDWLSFAAASSSANIATACGDNHVRVFQPQDDASLEKEWKCVADMDAHLGDVNCVAWCPRALPDGSALLVSAGDDSNVVLWRFGS